MWEKRERGIGNFNKQEMEECEMQGTKKILSIVSDRGKRGLELERVYRMLYNKNLFLMAYHNLYANEGAMTKGVNNDTVDGMSIEKIEKLIELIQKESYRWKPVRRTYIKKKNGKQRPLGLPTWTDKLLQEVIRIILNVYYEPQFNESSHGFRIDRGVHTALKEIRYNWKSVKWFIEGDISDCFGSIDHEILLKILSNKIKDNRFVRLIKHYLECGYMEEWVYNKTYSGCPQGGVLSPILSNIYMNEFDKFMEEQITNFNKGVKRAENKEYKAINKQVHKNLNKGNIVEYKRLKKIMQTMPSKDPLDKNFRRLYYVRYADDWLIGISGSIQESKQIKDTIKEYLNSSLGLTLSEEKTLITHAKNEKAKFLGHEIQVLSNDSKWDKRGQRIINGSIGFRVPDEVIKEKIRKYTKGGKPIQRAELITNSDYDIIMQFQSELRGIVQFYPLAYNVHMLYKLKRIMEVSLAKTLANKYKTTVNKIFTKYKTEIINDDKRYKVLQTTVERENKKPLVATFGGFSIAFQKSVVIKDTPTEIYNNRSELIDRLLRNECELCGSIEKVEMHHVRKLKDAVKKHGKNRPNWLVKMIAMNRKTLAVCQKCHNEIQYGRYDGKKLSEITS